MAHRIRKSFTFEAAHQLETAFTKACSDCIHGHSYTVELVIAADVLDERNMVVDFGILKAFKEQIMAKWDHGLILHSDKMKWFAPLITAGVLKGSKVNFLDENPTAETMARTLFYGLSHYLTKVSPALRLKENRIRVQAVRVHETSTGWAEFGEGR